MYKFPLPVLLLLLVFAAPTLAAQGLVIISSPHSVADTADRLQQALDAKGMTVFARIDHAAGAAKVGKDLPATELVIFGNPKVGTPLMECARTVAIDLPQKALIWEDADGQVWLAYNDPGYLAERHDLGEQCAKVIAKVSAVLSNFAAAATAP
jgi:uncharacterized protein (DUF302 family)